MLLMMVLLLLMVMLEGSLLNSSRSQGCWRRQDDLVRKWLHTTRVVLLMGGLYGGSLSHDLLMNSAWDLISTCCSDDWQMRVVQMLKSLGVWWGWGRLVLHHDDSRIHLRRRVHVGDARLLQETQLLLSCGCLRGSLLLWSGWGGGGRGSLLSTHDVIPGHWCVVLLLLLVGSGKLLQLLNWLRLLWLRGHLFQWLLLLLWLTINHRRNSRGRCCCNEVLARNLLGTVMSHNLGLIMLCGLGNHLR